MVAGPATQIAVHLIVMTAKRPLGDVLHTCLLEHRAQRNAGRPSLKATYPSVTTASGCARRGRAGDPNAAAADTNPASGHATPPLRRRPFASSAMSRSADNAGEWCRPRSACNAVTAMVTSWTVASSKGLEPPPQPPRRKPTVAPRVLRDDHRGQLEETRLVSGSPTSRSTVSATSRLPHSIASW